MVTGSNLCPVGTGILNCTLSGFPEKTSLKYNQVLSNVLPNSTAANAPGTSESDQVYGVGLLRIPVNHVPSAVLTTTPEGNFISMVFAAPDD